MAQSARAVRWIDDRTVAVGDVLLTATHDPGELKGLKSEVDHFVLGKPRSMVEDIAAFAPDTVENMVELGIFKGGSSVLYEALFQPHRLVAIERDATPVAALEAYRSSHGLDGVILPNYGVDQGDAEALEAVLAANFGARTLDLVIDDASHRYHPTKTSLNVLMKWLRPGGVFVLEDWGWAHWVGHTWQGPDPYLSGDLWLSNLAFELAMISASRPDLITALTIKPSVLAFTRGDGVVDADFDISTSYLTRGEGFELLGRPARHSSRTRWRRLAASIRAGRGSGPG